MTDDNSLMMSAKKFTLNLSKDKIKLIISIGYIVGYLIMQFVMINWIYSDPRDCLGTCKNQQWIGVIFYEGLLNAGLCQGIPLYFSLKFLNERFNIIDKIPVRISLN